MTYLNYIFFTRWLYFHHYWWRERGKNQFFKYFWKILLKFEKHFFENSWNSWTRVRMEFDFFSIFRFFSSTMTLDNLNTKKIRVPYEPLLKTFQKPNYFYSEQSLCINNSNSHCLDQISCFILITALSLFRFWVIKTLHEKKNFRLTEICEKDRKDFVSFRFTEISYFLNSPSNKNVGKQHLSTNAYFCVNMKFLCTIAGGKDEIFYIAL